MNISSNFRYASFVILLILLYSSFIYGYPSGVSGRTLKGPNHGCTCHTSAVTSGVQVLIAGPSTLKTGETGNYTATLTYSTLSGAGIDIATSTGTLTSSDTRLQVMNGELTQKSSNTGSGSITWNFKYTAPSAAGSQTLYATACAKKSAWNDSPNFTVNVISGTSLSLLTPNGGENWQTGTTKNITWSGSGIQDVKIEYSTDNGISWNTIIASTPASSGSYAWLVPNTISSQCKVRISDQSNLSVFITSVNVFSITAASQIFSVSHLHQNDANGASLDAGSTVTIKGIITVGNEFNSPSFIQDSTGGVAVYGRGASAFSGMVRIGDIVQLTGTVVNYNGLTEFNPVTDFSKSDSGKTVKPLELTISQINNQSWQNAVEPYEGLLVKIKHVKLVTPISLWAVSGSGSNFNVTDGTDTLQVRVYSVVTSIANQPAPQGWFDITGALGQYKSPAPYKGGYQLQPRFAQDITVVTGLKEDDGIRNISYNLEQNFPNPFNPTTNIKFGLPEEANVTLAIFDQLGKKVAVLADGKMNAGIHTITWNAGNVPSGIYFYELHTEKFSSVKKLILLK